MDNPVRAYLDSIAGRPPYRQATCLMSKISSAAQYGRPVAQEFMDRLQAICEPKRFRKWHRRLERLQQKTKNRGVVPPTIRSPAAPTPRVNVTKTVHYQYDPVDNRRIAEFLASREWHLMRYEALRLHGGRCQCCGASPEDRHTILNVDHIKPLRVFWELRLDIANLQVLCGPCNEGKGARHADDWR